MASIDEILSNASPVERTVKVCVAGQLSGEYERLSLEINQETLNPSNRLSGNARLAELQEERDSIARLMEEATYLFRFQALPAKAWSDLISEHPDKEGTSLFDPDTFVPAAILRTCTEPEGMDSDKGRGLLDSLSAAQQSELFDAAWGVNQNAPKGLTYSNESEVHRD